MMEKDGFGSDYDLLSRFGEWDGADKAKNETTKTDSPDPKDKK